MTDVIRRKIDRARPSQAEGAPGADRGWRLALARAVRDMMGLELELQGLTVLRQSLAEVLEQVPDLALLALLDGPRGGLGVMMLAPVVTATLIEMQTFGRLGPQAPTPRKSSRIDAAMVAGVIDRALAGLDETLAEEADQTWAAGFRYASYLEDARPLALMLEEDAYRVITARVVLGGGLREGQVILVLPAVGRGSFPESVVDPVAAEAPQFTAALNAQVLQADSSLDAVIGRVTLPLRQIMTMTPGEVLVLPTAGTDALTLETIEGRRIAAARLGQLRGMRAVMLTETVASRLPETGQLRREAGPAAATGPGVTAASAEEGLPDFRAAG